MKLRDFIKFSVLKIFTYDIGDHLLCCDKDKHHVEIELKRKTLHSTHSKKYPAIDKFKALDLINQAKKSFASGSYAKLKNKYMPELELDDDAGATENVFYLSKDKKFYCFFMSVIYDEERGIYMFGILDKINGKYLVYESNYISSAIHCYYHDIAHCEFTNHLWDAGCSMCPLIAISHDTKEFLTGKSKPGEIINAINDYYNTIYDDVYGLLIV